MEKISKGSKYERVVRTPDGSAVSNDDFLIQAREMWAQQVSEARALLNRLQTASPEAQTGIHEGVRTFIEKIRRPLKADADISAITSAIASYLDHSLSFPEMPESTSPVIRRDSGIYFLGGDSSLVRPRAAAIFMQKYGLPDGSPKSLEELSEKYILTKSAIGQNATQAGRKILRDPSVRQLIRH